MMFLHAVRESTRAVAAAVTVGVLLTACEPALTDEEPDYSGVPTVCPKGFARGLGAALNNIQAVGEVDPGAIGLGQWADKIACAVRADSADTGAFAIVVMRAGISEDDVRHAAWALDFDDGSHGYMARNSATRGGVEGFLRQTYGSLSSALSTRGWRFGGVFPPRTVVLNADLNVPHIRKKCEDSGSGPFPDGKVDKPLPAPAANVVSCRPWTTKEMRDQLDDAIAKFGLGGRSGERWCEDVTSIDYNWQNDMLCHRPDGTQFYTDYAGADAYLG